MEKLAEQEREIQALSAEINNLRKRIEAETVPPSARLAKLRAQNQKLKYQKLHLERYVCSNCIRSTFLF
jgi:capsule polysaccharide export protein KpsE/RkpR